MPDLLKHLETRSQAFKIHYSDPTSTREWIVWRSRDRDEVLAHLTNFNLPPAVDTVAGTPRYLQSAELNEVGNGVWKYKANYAKDPNTVTIEINYTGGTKKMLQSLQLVRSYGCDTFISGATQDASDVASSALEALTPEAYALNASIPVAEVAIGNANNAVTDPAMEPLVYLHCVESIANSQGAVNQANKVLGFSDAVIAAVNNVINAANVGNPVAATDAAISAQAASGYADVAAAAATSDAADAQSDAADAVAEAAAGAPSVSSIAAGITTDAANAAYVAATNAANVAIFIGDAADAADDIVSGIAADAAGGIPNVGTMINVTDKGVDGVEIEDDKCDITITKHFVATMLPSGYLETLRSMYPCKNDADFVINYKGQIITYKAGELKFKNFTYKQGGDNTVDITYFLASSKNSVEADNYTIGNSPPIVKEGWDYLSVFYVDSPDQAAFCKSKKPKAVYIHRVYRAEDFSKLQLF